MKDVVADGVDKFKEMKDATSLAKQEIKTIGLKGKEIKDKSIEKLTKIVKRGDDKKSKILEKTYRETESQGDLK